MLTTSLAAPPSPMSARRRWTVLAVCALSMFLVGVDTTIVNVGLPEKKAATTDGLVVSTRARFGSTAAPGTTDDARIRDITQALPPVFADRLFTARERGATEQQLQQIAAEGLAQMYFRANNSRAHGLGVEFTDVEHIEIEL